MAQIEPPVKCNGCMANLSADVRCYKNESVVYVEPCWTCHKAEISSAEEKGWTDGYREGWAAHEADMKEDIRKAVKLTQDVCAESKGGDSVTPNSSS